VEEKKGKKKKIKAYVKRVADGMNERKGVGNTENVKPFIL
jgi:hypothetical protein